MSRCGSLRKHQDNNRVSATILFWHSSIKYLGLYFNQHFTWWKHVEVTKIKFFKARDKPITAVLADSTMLKSLLTYEILTWITIGMFNLQNRMLRFITRVH